MKQPMCIVSRDQKNESVNKQDTSEEASLVFLILLLETFIRGLANNGQLACYIYVATQKKLRMNNALISKF